MRHGAVTFFIFMNLALPKPQAVQTCNPLTLATWDETLTVLLTDAVSGWQSTTCPGAEVHIQLIPWPEYQTLLSTGELPDVFILTPIDAPIALSQERLLNLQPYLNTQGVDATLWPSGLVEPYRMEEAADLYALPVTWESTAIYYNKTMFNDADLPYPQPDWTWDDFAEVAKTLTQLDQGIYGAAVYSGYQAGYATWIASTGVSPVMDSNGCTLEEEGSLRALNFLKGLQDAGLMPNPSEMGGISGDAAFDYWAGGRAAMITGSSWKLLQALEDVEFEWDVAPLPHDPETGRSRSIASSLAFAANAKTQNPALAAELILYLTLGEGQHYFSFAPADFSPEIQELWRDAIEPKEVNIQVFIDALQDSQSITIPYEVWDIANTDLVLNIFEEGMGVESAASAACASIEAALSG
jgi:multiple sugar transport system substrate-binding protein